MGYTNSATNSRLSYNQRKFAPRYGRHNGIITRSPSVSRTSTTTSFPTCTSSSSGFCFTAKFGDAYFVVSHVIEGNAGADCCSARSYSHSTTRPPERRQTSVLVRNTVDLPGPEHSLRVGHSIVFLAARGNGGAAAARGNQLVYVLRFVECVAI